MNHLRIPVVAPLVAVLAGGCSTSSSTSPQPDASSTSPQPDAGDSGRVNDAGVTSDSGDELSEAGVDAGGTQQDSGVDPLAGCTKDPGAPPVQVDAGAASDPIGGADKFTLADALAGFPAGSGKLVALIATEQGTIRCTLDDAAAPVTVSNFVGLARGTRPFLAGSAWKVGRFYDGLTWHRVIPDFVIQGGDPEGTGFGGPGYDLIDENHTTESLGTLAMAAGAAPSGSQFYIVVGTPPSSADYNVFGTCTTDAAVAIANVPRNADDKPLTPVHTQHVEIARCP